MSNDEIQQEQNENVDTQKEAENQDAQQQNDEQHSENALPELQDYDQIEGKLKEIQGRIENEDMSLDESLDLYEQAVALGMQATKTIEQNVTSHLAKEDEEEDGDNADNDSVDNPKDNVPSSKEIFGD